MKSIFLLITLMPFYIFAQSPCSLPPDSGPCLAAIPAYFFNQESQQCDQFTWGGCGIVPFETLQDCEASDCAITTPIDSCIAIPVEDCSYFLLWEPVCGCDGITYSNSGAAFCNSIYEYTPGECTSQTDILGCTDQEACNFNIDATVEDESCEYAEEYYNCAGVCEYDIDEDDVCDFLDNCMLIANFNQLDSDFDAEGDLCDYDDGLNIEKHQTTEPILLKKIDVLGKTHSNHTKGKMLFYIYSDHSVVKKVIH